LRENIIRAQLPDKQPAMAQWFENLMDGIERNLLTKNRDRFVILVKNGFLKHF
jgi:exportin-7